MEGVAGRITLLGVSLLAVALLLAGSLFAAASPTAPLPALASLLPSTADLGAGTKLIAERQAKLVGQTTLMRVYSRPSGGIAVALALPESDGSHAESDFGIFRTEVGLREGRATFARAFGTAFVQGAKIGSQGKANVTVTKAVVGPPVALGSDAFRFAATLKTSSGTTARVAFAVVQVDRVLEVVAIFAERTIPPAAIDGVVSAAKRRLGGAFTVVNTAAPTISGTAQQGQPLTLDRGRWLGAPTAFAYAWSRCDATGSGCTTIPGATGGTYVPVADDSGATLRVTVTGSNTVSSGKASSPPTPVVA
jgi:hypothetical protein